MASSSSSGLTFKLHPLVIVNISDHYTRVKTQSQPPHLSGISNGSVSEASSPPRVFGCVIGVQRGRTVEIFNSFELLYDPSTHSLDRAFLEKKQELYKKVFPQFYILGWYSTGNDAQESDMHIHKAACDTEKLRYNFWEEKVKVIYRHERKRQVESSTFFDVVYQILVDRWNKSDTSPHCLADSLNPLCYGDVRLREDPNRINSNLDDEVSSGRNKCMRIFFDDPVVFYKVVIKSRQFSMIEAPFTDCNSLQAISAMGPYTLWRLYGSGAHLL